METNMENPADQLILVEPQKRFRTIIRAYDKAERMGIHRALKTEAVAVLILKQPFRNLSAGTKLLWVGGKHCHTQVGVFGDRLNKWFTPKLRLTYLDIMDLFDPSKGDDLYERFDGIDLDSPETQENEYVRFLMEPHYSYLLKKGRER